MGTAILPLLNNNEEDREFLDTAIRETGEIILLLVIDTNAMSGGFGFATGQIARGNEAMEKCAEYLKKKGTAIETIEEWGDTTQKIIAAAKMKNSKKVILKKQDNHYFKTLVKKLKEGGLEAKILATSESSPSE